MIDEKKIKTREDELNISLYINKLFGGIIGVSTRTYSLIEIAFKKPLAVLSFIMICMGGMFLLYKISKPVFKTDIVVYSNYFNNDYCAELIGDLDKLAEENNAPMLAQRLKVSLEHAENIKSISYHNFNPKFKKIFKDSIAQGVPFRIEVMVLNNEILDYLEQGLINYLDNNEYALVRRKITERNLLELKSKIGNEQVKLDSLKLIIAESIIPRGSGNGIIYGEPLNPVEIYKETINLFEKELQIYKDLTLLKNVEIIKGFTKFNYPYRPKLWINLMIGFFGGLILGIAFAYFLIKREQGRAGLN
jgi:hypothetical protein